MLSGFGARCCDLIRRGKMPKERPLPYAVRRAEKHELPRIAALENALNRHMGACPVYMPKPFYTPESDLREVEEEHLAVYAAFDGDESVAHLAVHPDGETFLDQNPASRHIGAAYCRPEYCGNGLIDALLDAAQRDLAAQGVPLTAVMAPGKESGARAVEIMDQYLTGQIPELQSDMLPIQLKRQQSVIRLRRP